MRKITRIAAACLAAPLAVAVLAGAAVPDVVSTWFEHLVKGHRHLTAAQELQLTALQDQVFEPCVLERMRSPSVRYSLSGGRDSEEFYRDRMQAMTEAVTARELARLVGTTPYKRAERYAEMLTKCGLPEAGEAALNRVRHEARWERARRREQRRQAIFQRDRKVLQLAAPCLRAADTEAERDVCFADAERTLGP